MFYWQMAGLIYVKQWHGVNFRESTGAVVMHSIAGTCNVYHEFVKYSINTFILLWVALCCRKQWCISRLILVHSFELHKETVLSPFSDSWFNVESTFHPSSHSLRRTVEGFVFLCGYCWLRAITALKISFLHMSCTFSSA